MATLVRRYFATLRPAPAPGPRLPPRPALCLPSLPLSQELERQRKTEQIIPNTKRKNEKKCLKSLTKICCLTYTYILHTLYIYLYVYKEPTKAAPVCAGRGRQRQHALHKIPNFLLFFVVFFSSASNNKKKNRKKIQKPNRKNKRKAETKETCKRNVQDSDASTALHRYIDYTISYTISYSTMGQTVCEYIPFCCCF